VAVLSIFKDISVKDDLYAIIFGESTINDAVSIVLFGAIVRFYEKQNDVSSAIIVWEFIYIFTLSVLLGIVFGLFVSWILSKYHRTSDDNSEK